ncbi:MAG: SCO6880 family protein, partial [Frankia sp.]
LARVHAVPLAVNATWDAVRVDSAWHRVFWVAQWPTLDLAAGWINPLLLAAPGARTVAVVMEPVSLRTSRRRINADTVSIEGQMGMRERHAFRVPVGLSRAQAHVDQREEELSAGFCEYSYLALVDVCAPTRDDLDDACHAMVDLAAQCGITELRPLHGRHDMAWAATLPLGRVPSKPLLRSGA